MFQPTQVSRRNTGIRLQPLPNSVVKIPLFDNSGYANPALQDIKVYPGKLRYVHVYYVTSVSQVPLQYCNNSVTNLRIKTVLSHKILKINP